MLNGLKRIEAAVENAPRLVVIAVALAFVSGLYLITNHFHWREPSTLPFLFWEDRMPLMPWMAAVYWGYIPKVMLCIAIVPKRGFGRAVVAAAVMALAIIAVFAVFPTAYPRPASGHLLMRAIALVDTPGNCFPSLHIAIDAFATVVVWRTMSRWVGLAAVISAVAIAISTLATKQHYALDIFGGWFCAAVAYGFVCRRLGGESGESGERGGARNQP